MIILDRFEEDTAILEIDGEIAEVPRKNVAASAGEGDVLNELNGSFTVDEKATESRRAAMREKMRRLIHKND